jgi:hypothetical protein
MRRSHYLDEILSLDPVRDHKRIVQLDVCFEFPWDTTRSLELALFRTFGVPSIARLLDSTGEFARASQKRYDDTDLIISTILEDGYDSETGTRALRQMNRIHSRFEISNDDFVYVLSTFVLEPIRWNARFGWRPMMEAERLASFHCWREIGRRMNIKGIPQEYAELERFNEGYERKHFATGAAARRPRSHGSVPAAAPAPKESHRAAAQALLPARLRARGARPRAEQLEQPRRVGRRCRLVLVHEVAVDAQAVVQQRPNPLRPRRELGIGVGRLAQAQVAEGGLALERAYADGVQR